MCCLCLGETVDGYLAELHKIVVQFRGMTKSGLIYAFIAGLPGHVEKLPPFGCMN